MFLPGPGSKLILWELLAVDKPSTTSTGLLISNAIGADETTTAAS